MLKKNDIKYNDKKNVVIIYNYTFFPWIMTIVRGLNEFLVYTQREMIIEFIQRKIKIFSIKLCMNRIQKRLYCDLSKEEENI